MARTKKASELLEEAMKQTKVEHILEQASTMSDVIVIGFDEEGEMSLFSTVIEGPNILWAIELAKSQILEMGVPTDD
jgi:ribonuclease HIII